MKKATNYHAPVSLDELNQKLSLESKRLIREREDGVVKCVGRVASLKGTSTLVFININGMKMRLSYRLDASGVLRFAREKRFAGSIQNKTHASAALVGRTSADIKG